MNRLAIQRFLWGESRYFKRGSKFLLAVALLVGLVYWLLPASISHQQEVSRGTVLTQQLDAFYRQHHTLPATNDWPLLKQLGFTEAELNAANPEYHHLAGDAYELTFVKGFDGPYLTWNSRERSWKSGFPTLPVR